MYKAWLIKYKANVSVQRLGNFTLSESFYCIKQTKII